MTPDARDPGYAAKNKLFTFLKVKGVPPTNNHAERALRFLVIMRKICFGTRSDAGSESHAVLPSLLQTAKLHGRDALAFLATLITKPLDAAKAAPFGSSAASPGGSPPQAPRRHRTAPIIDSDRPRSRQPAASTPARRS